MLVETEEKLERMKDFSYAQLIIAWNQWEEKETQGQHLMPCVLKSHIKDKVLSSKVGGHSLLYSITFFQISVI